MRRHGRESGDVALRPKKRPRHLTRDPLGGRMVRHADAHQSPAGVTKNDQAIEQLEGDGANHEQIDGRDPGGVIAEECLPTLGGRPCRLVMYRATADWATSIPKMKTSMRATLRCGPTHRQPFQRLLNF